MQRQILEDVVRRMPNVLDEMLDNVEVSLSSTVDRYDIGTTVFYSGPGGPVDRPSNPMDQQAGFTGNACEQSNNGYGYTEPVNPSLNGGLKTAQPFQTGFDLPATELQLHLHGPDTNTITYGTIKDYQGNVVQELNGYESSMASLNAEKLKFKPFNK